MKNKYHKDVHYICKLPCREKIEKIYGKLKNYDVVLTDERKTHILNRRKNDGIDVLINLKDCIRNYDYVIDAGDKSIKCIKISTKRNYAYIIKLSLESHQKANSVISGMIIGKKKVNKYISTKRIIHIRKVKKQNGIALN